MKILLIDDEVDILESLADFLKFGGHDCKPFMNPHEAIDAYKKEKFDVVITDYKMPSMNGIEVSQTIRQHNQNAHIIIMSGWDPLEIYNKIETNNYTFLEKPFSIVELMDALSKIEKDIFGKT